MILCGADPDTKATGICIYDTENPGHFHFEVANAYGAKAQDRMVEMAQNIDAIFLNMKVDALAIEWQHIRPGDPRPNDIMAVQAVSGMLLAAASRWTAASRIFLPIPVKWRGSQKKEIVQGWFLKDAGLTLDSPEFRDIPRGQRSHVVDALGLVLWMRKQLGV